MKRNAGDAPNRRPTIRQVAELAKVAPATVSEVLNNRPTCWASQATRQRIIEAAQRIGYRASPAARALRGKRTQTVGLVIPAFDAEMAARVFSAFEHAAQDAGNLVFAATTRGQETSEDRAIQWMLDHQIDGLAVYPSRSGTHKTLRSLAAGNFPVVAIGARGHLDFSIDQVMPDFHAGGAMQARVMLEAGKRRIALLKTDQMCCVTDEKVRGTLDTLRDAGIERPLILSASLPAMTEQSWRMDDLNILTDVVRRHVGQFDGLICIGDAYAFASIRTLTSIGVRVPEDVAVIGYDGIGLGTQANSPLTTIINPPEAIGTGAFELLSSRMARAGERLPPRQLTIPPTLLRRASA